MKIENNKIKVKLQITKFLDECRWSCKENYYMINYSPNIKNIEDKRLIHWLSYITDRQMPFEQIWDVGGYVFSDLISEYKKSQNKWEQILEIDGKYSYFKKDDRKNKKGEAFVTDYPKEEKEEPEYIRKIKYYTNNIDKEKGKIYFKPRYYPNDYISIYRTLHILNEFCDKNFDEYIRNLIKMAKALPISEAKTIEQRIVWALADGLYFLTYEGGMSKKSEKDKDSGEKIKEHMTCFFERYKKDDRFIEVKNSQSIKENLEIALKDRIMTNDKTKNFKNKRLWCALRDYIKSDELKIDNILKDEGIDIEKLKKYLELPGDVWNNNEKFSSCLFPKQKGSEYYFDMDAKEKKYIIADKETNIETLNEFLSELKKSDKCDFKDWYPEQFDVTFNLAANSCSHNKCEYCPYGLLNAKIKSKVRKICSEKEGNYCPVVMNCCGYAVKCNPKKCIIKDIINKK